MMMLCMKSNRTNTFLQTKEKDAHALTVVLQSKYATRLLGLALSTGVVLLAPLDGCLAEALVGVWFVPTSMSTFFMPCVLCFRCAVFGPVRVEVVG